MFESKITYKNGLYTLEIKNKNNEFRYIYKTKKKSNIANLIKAFEEYKDPIKAYWNFDEEEEEETENDL